jgi:tetraacyldisaccharide 4'-kinase
MLKEASMNLASTLWSGVSGVTRGAARTGLLKSVKLGPRVISVGNIQVGGAGKTPIVAQIAREAHQRGLKICILSRGYKGEWEATGGILGPEDRPARASQSGDEPALLHELCPWAYIGIGANRIRQYETLLKKFQTQFDLILLDDGFQNWRIQKDLEIVALTSARPNQVIFRDSPKALKYADLLVWTKGEVCPNAYGKPMVRIKYQLPRASSKQPLWLITGIADGQTAYTLAMMSGYQIRRYIFYGDHARYDHSKIALLMKQATAAGCKIALTGKDWMKWRDFNVSSSEIVVLEPELVFEEGRDLWSQMLWRE